MLDASGLREQGDDIEIARHRVGWIGAGDGQTRIGNTQHLRRRVDNDTGHEMYAQGIGQRLQAVRIAGVIKPQQVTATFNELLDQRHLARHQICLRAGQHQHRSVVGNGRTTDQIHRLNLEALLLQALSPGTEVVIGLTQRLALAVALEEHQPALAAARQALQGVGDALLGQAGELFLPALILDQQLAVDADAQLAHPCRLQIRVDEFQGDITLVALITRQEVADGVPYRLVLGGKGGDINRAIELFKQSAASRREGIAATGCPVCGKGVARAEPRQHPHQGEEQDQEQGVLNTRGAPGFTADKHSARSTYIDPLNRRESDQGTLIIILTGLLAH